MRLEFVFSLACSWYNGTVLYSYRVELNRLTTSMLCSECILFAKAYMYKYYNINIIELAPSTPNTLPPLDNGCRSLATTWDNTMRGRSAIDSRFVWTRTALRCRDSCTLRRSRTVIGTCTIRTSEEKDRLYILVIYQNQSLGIFLRMRPHLMNE